MKKLDEAVQQYLSGIARRGGEARAAKYDKTTLKMWGRLGGRPRKKAQTKSKKEK